MAERGLSLVVESGGYSLAAGHKSLTVERGLSSCGTRA